jgi:hypothetical protein
MTEELNFKAICDLTTRVLDMPKGALSLRSRKRPLQIARSVAAYIGLTEEDIKRSVIAKVLKRDRTATYHYENKHKKNFIGCGDYRSCFEKIYKAYKDISGVKNIFSDKDFLKSHLLQNGVREVVKHDVYLEVKSGRVKCKIKTSYFDFYNQLENIKNAMTEYHYTVNIL